MTETGDQYQPTAEIPQLLGILIDVSGSMLTKALRSADGSSQARIASVRDSLDELVRRAADYCRDEAGSDIIPKLGVFAYGFGFGNLLSRFARWPGTPVTDMLDLPGCPRPAIPIDELARDWPAVQDNMRALVRHMGGDTPMAEALRTARRRIAAERARQAWTDQPVLFLLSDGMPTDAAPDAVLEIADRLKADGVLIMTCLLTEDKVVERRRMFGTIQPTWTAAAQLMFGCASQVSDDLPVGAHLEGEFGWTVDSGARLFTIADNSASLSDFLAGTLSRIRPQQPGPAGPQTTRLPGGSPEPHAPPAVHVEHMYGPMVAGSVTGLSQQITVNELGLLQDLLRTLSRDLPTAGLSPEADTTAQRAAGDLAAETEQAEPDRSKIRALLRKLGAVLATGAEQATATALNAAIQKALGSI